VVGNVRRWRRKPARLKLALAVMTVALLAAACLPQAPPSPPPAPAQLSITPSTQASSDDFPRAGGTVQQLLVKNVGEQTTGVLGAPTTTGAPQFSVTPGTCGGSITLAPNATCLLTVTFTATAGGDGAVSGDVSISASPGGTVTAVLNGTERDSTPLNVAPSGSTDLTDDNEPGGTVQTVVVSNFTAFPANDVEISLQFPSGAGSFSTDDDCLATLPALSSCVVEVTYTNDAGDGSTGAVGLVVSAPTSDPTTVPFTGEATGTPNVMSFDVASVSLTDEFPPDDLQPGASVTVTLTNNGAAPTSLLSFGLVNSVGIGVLSFPSTNCNLAPIPAGGTCFIEIAFRATDDDGRIADLEVKGTPGGFLSIPVTGTAVAP
jgi:hypothetical protein